MHKHSPSITGRVLAVLGPITVLFRKEAKYQRHLKAIQEAVPKYPEVHVSPESGDPAVLLKAVCEALDKAGIPRPQIAAFVTEALADDYGNMLVTIARWVTVDE